MAFCKPDFAADDAVSEICRRLDDLPLALELAAARVKALSSAQILERLEQRLALLTGGARDLPERQRTLRAAIEWSHELLTSEERRLFARLAVFNGSCTLEAAERIADADLDSLQSLVDKSLLRQADERFLMLGTIREYAAERLDDSGEAGGLRQRHAEHFVALAEEAEPSVLGISPSEWLDRLERDHDNLRAALDWLEAAGESQLALRLGGAVWEFWCLRCHFAEGWRRLEELLRADQQPTLARAKALTGSVHLWSGTGSPSVAAQRRRAEQALALYSELDHEWGIAYAEYQFAHVSAEEGDFTAARPLLEASVRRLRDVGDEHRALQAMGALASCYEELGEVDRAMTLVDDRLRGARAARDRQVEAQALAQLAKFATNEGRFRDALTLLDESYRLADELGDSFEILSNLLHFARTLAFAERAATGARLLSRFEAMQEEIGTTDHWWLNSMVEETHSRIRAQLDDAAFAEAWEQGRTLTAAEAIALAVEELP